MSCRPFGVVWLWISPHIPVLLLLTLQCISKQKKDFFKGLNVVAVPRLRDVGGRERKWNISGSPPVYQAQLKWIKPGWPIRHKLNFLHDSITYPTLPPFLTTALQTSIPVQDWPHHKLTGSQYLRKYCCNPDTRLQKRQRWSQKNQGQVKQRGHDLTKTQ